MKLEGRVALVTGGASGLGEAAVKRFVQEGCKVVIADVQQELGKALVQSLGEDKALFVETDVTDEAAVQNLINKAVERFGAIHIVLNSAGIIRVNATLSSKSTAKGYMRILSINVLGTFNVTKAASMVMVKQPTLNDKGERGVIINIASVAGLEGQAGNVMYSGTKGAIIGMTMPLARDLGKFGIRVNAIAPGIFRTPMAAGIDEKYAKVFARFTPLGRLGAPEEFADLCTTICTNSYLTGDVLRVDGGIRLPHL